MLEKIEKNIYNYTFFISLLISSINKYINSEILQTLVLLVFVIAYFVKKVIISKQSKKIDLLPNELYDYFVVVIFLVLSHGLYVDVFR